MSIVVAPENLADALARYTFAYLVTTGGTGSAHVVAVSPTLAHDRLHVGGLGRTTRANIGARAQVTLVWPPASPDDFSLIVDGTADLRDGTAVVAPTRAVLHRGPPADQEPPGGCDVNCRELSAGAGRRHGGHAGALRQV